MEWTAAEAVTADPYGMLASQQMHVTLDTPELRLLAAVLDDALRILGKTAHQAHEETYRAAVRWMRSDRQASCFDFVPLCEVLGLDPACVRHALRDQLGARPAPSRDFVCRRTAQKRWRQRHRVERRRKVA